MKIYWQIKKKWQVKLKSTAKTCITFRRLPLVLPTSGPIPRVLGCGLTSYFGELNIPIDQSLLSTGKKKNLSSTSHTDTSMTYCQSITQILRIIWVRCMTLNLRSKARQRATHLLPTWIYSCRAEGRSAVYFPLRQTWRIQLPYHKLSVPEQQHSIFASLCFILRAERLSS